MCISTGYEPVNVIPEREQFEYWHPAWMRRVTLRLCGLLLLGIG